MAKKVTMQDIANELNISKNSVSQALTGKSGVSEDTRKKIMEVAACLGYQYHQLKGKPNEKPGQIGLLASETVIKENVFFGTIYVSIQKEVKKRGCDLLVHAVDQESEAKNILPSFLLEEQVQGLVILSHLQNQYIQSVLQAKLPTVLVDHHHPSLFVDSVLTNNRFGAYIATDHLLRLGHKRIGFIGNVRQSPSYQERYDGYCLALHDRGIRIDEALLLLNPIQKREFMVEFLNSCSTFPTAWFCVNDTLGLHLIQALTQIGVKVPEDISVCGFDNNLVSELSTPALSTIHIYKDYFAQRAVDRLFWRMEYPETLPEELVLPVKLLERGSTSAAKL